MELDRSDPFHYELSINIEWLILIGSRYLSSRGFLRVHSPRLRESVILEIAARTSSNLVSKLPIPISFDAMRKLSFRYYRVRVFVHPPHRLYLYPWYARKNFLIAGCFHRNFHVLLRFHEIGNQLEKESKHILDSWTINIFSYRFESRYRVIRLTVCSIFQRSEWTQIRWYWVGNLAIARQLSRDFVVETQSVWSVLFRTLMFVAWVKLPRIARPTLSD